MYTVMIVDDEVAIREKLPQAIDFGRHGFRVSATAKNGAEALALLPLHQPDLIFLDVRMPVMDGLAFLEELRKGPYQDIQVVILSGYSDFEYARMAMRLGVKSYLTKPVDEDEAAAYLREIAAGLSAREKERERLQYRQDLKRLRQAYDAGDGVLSMPEYCLLHLLLRNALQESPHPYQIISDWLQAHTGIHEDGILIHRGCVFSLLIAKEALKNIHASPAIASSKVHASLSEKGLECFVFADDVSLRETGIPFRTIYTRQLASLGKPAFYGVEPGVLSDVGEETGPDATLDAAYEALRGHLVAMDQPKVLEGLEALYSTIEARQLAPQTVFQIADRLYYLLTDLITTNSGRKHERPMLYRIEWLDAPHFMDLARWKELQTRQLVDVLDYMRQNRRLQGMGVGQDILDYVYENYRDAITLKEVADIYHMNPAYLGRVFQKATGSNFRQYINGLRIAEAKRLLQSSDKLIYEIAEEVGFSESSYFISKFMREVGVSPMEFRKG